MHYAYFDSPFGSLEIQSDGEYITEVAFVDKKSEPQSSDDAIKAMQTWLDSYFAKKPLDIDVPLKIEGSEVRKKVLFEITQIPFGTTTSYKDIAQKAGTHPRAVGSVGRSNRHAVIIPCHRVIKSDGKLSEYKWHRDVKRQLLEFETSR